MPGRNSAGRGYVPWSAKDLCTWRAEIEQNHRCRVRVTFLPGVRPSEMKVVGHAYRVDEGRAVVLLERYTVFPSNSAPTLEAALLRVWNELDAGLTWVKAEVPPAELSPGGDGD